MHEPVVLAAVTDTTNLKGLWADNRQMGHVASGRQYPIEEAPMLVATTPILLPRFSRWPESH